MSKICSFTGHREIPRDKYLEISQKLEGVLRDLIANEGFTDFRTGGATGFDTVAALCVASLKKDYPNIKLHLILPCRDQHKYFSNESKHFYEYTKKIADSITYTQEKYHSSVMYIRNRVLVEGADMCIAYLTSLSGGTYQTVNLARKSKVKVINVATLK